jgi:hypothetical protein
MLGCYRKITDEAVVTYFQHRHISLLHKVEKNGHTVNSANSRGRWSDAL